MLGIFYHFPRHYYYFIRWSLALGGSPDEKISFKFVS